MSDADRLLSIEKDFLSMLYGSSPFLSLSLYPFFDCIETSIVDWAFTLPVTAKEPFPVFLSMFTSLGIITVYLELSISGFTLFCAFAMWMPPSAIPANISPLINDIFVVFFISLQIPPYAYIKPYFVSYLTLRITVNHEKILD